MAISTLRWKEKATSSAVSGEPSENFTPSRIVHSYVVSFVKSHDCAASGTGFCDPGGNCSGPIAEARGDNLDSGTSCGFSRSTDLTSTDPLLGPLADNGGTIPTLALLPGRAGAQVVPISGPGGPVVDTAPPDVAVDPGDYTHTGPTAPTVGAAVIHVTDRPAAATHEPGPIPLIAATGVTATTPLWSPVVGSRTSTNGSPAILMPAGRSDGLPDGWRTSAKNPATALE